MKLPPLDPRDMPSRALIDEYTLTDPARAAQLVSTSREAARRSFACFLKYWMFATRAPFMWNWHWHYLSDVMQAVADRDPLVRMLIVNIPPRFAKSTILSQLWQAWMIGRENTRRSALFSISTTATLAARDSRRTMDTIRAPWYKNVFPGVLIGGKETESEWETNGGAYRIACGTGGQVIGRGADHLLVDDPIKAEDANSELIREKTNEWLGETLRSRLDDQKTGTITVIMQRLHERDPTGYLLSQSKMPGADQYHQIILPHEATRRTLVSFNGRHYAVREPGALLHPDRIGPKEAAALRISMRENYEGQYQQNPVKMTGGMLDPRKLVRIGGTATELIQRFGLRPNFYIDFATRERQGAKDDPDYSVIAVMARDQLRRVFILAVWRKQCALDVLANTLIDMHAVFNPRRVKGERGGLLNTFRPMLKERQLARNSFFTLHPTEARTTDKLDRASTFESMLNAGLIHVPEHAPWLPDLEGEMRAFPRGSHDDQIDPIADGCRDTDDLRAGEAPVTQPEDPIELADVAVKRRIEEAKQRLLAGERAPLADVDVGW
jgi:predicted phage terminase large subunit-like protein